MIVVQHPRLESGFAIRDDLGFFCGANCFAYIYLEDMKSYDCPTRFSTKQMAQSAINAMQKECEKEGIETNEYSWNTPYASNDRFDHLHPW